MNGEEAKWRETGADESIPQEAFTDPVVRCDSCTKLVKAGLLKKLGACPNCGNKRVRNVTIFNEEEKEQLTEWGFHDFLKEFEGVEDD